MIKRNLMNNTKTRRKGSMLQDSLSKIKYLLVLAVLLVFPMQAMAGLVGGVPVINQTDTGVNRLVAYFDTRDRDSFVQVTNTSSSNVGIHVQVWDVASQFTECEECNFDDLLTGFDTHVYEMEDMRKNSGGDLVCTEIGAGTYGFVVISRSFGPSNSLIGVFRIIDAAGYEYRTNAAGPQDAPPADVAFDHVVNFSDANGNTLSDLVGITYVHIDSDTVFAGPGVSVTFGSVVDEILIWDQNEDDISCSSTTFACAVGLMNKGIDNALPNSLGQPNRVCASSILDTNTAGWLDLPFAAFNCVDPDPLACENQEQQQRPQFFVGFIGLNNGDGTGSMDSWWQIGYMDFIGDGPE